MAIAAGQAWSAGMAALRAGRPLPSCAPQPREGFLQRVLRRSWWAARGCLGVAVAPQRPSLHRAAAHARLPRPSPPPRGVVQLVLLLLRLMMLVLGTSLQGTGSGCSGREGVRVVRRPSPLSALVLPVQRRPPAAVAFSRQPFAMSATTVTSADSPAYAARAERFNVAYVARDVLMMQRLSRAVASATYHIARGRIL